MSAFNILLLLLFGARVIVEIISCVLYSCVMLMPRATGWPTNVIKETVLCVQSVQYY